MRYRAADPAALIVEPLDTLTAVFHRTSGITHLLTEPAPEILAALAGDALTVDALMDRLAQRFALADPDRVALVARLDELVEAGLASMDGA